MLPTFLTTKSRRGVSLVETIVYVVLLTIVTSVIIQMLISISGVYRGIKLTRELESSGSVAMETILREVRNASSVVEAESTFGVSPGTLTVSFIDEAMVTHKVVFAVSAGAITTSTDGSASVAISSGTASTSELLFTHFTSPNSEAVRVELQMSGFAGSATKSQKFYGFAVLRGTY